MSGISFDLCKIKAILLDVDGVLSSSSVGVDENGKLLRSINIKDVVGVNKAIAEGIVVGVISKGSESELEKYLSHFNIDKESVHFDVKNKNESLIDFLRTHQLKEEEVIFFVSDVADAGVLSLSCLFVAPADVSIDILQRANYISDYAGGAGVVREVVEQVLRAQQKWCF